MAHYALATALATALQPLNHSIYTHYILIIFWKIMSIWNGLLYILIILLVVKAVAKGVTKG